jgi:hypothetical protein
MNNSNENFVFASSIIEAKEGKTQHKSATVKQILTSTVEYHETYY